MTVVTTTGFCVLDCVVVFAVAEVVVLSEALLVELAAAAVSDGVSVDEDSVVDEDEVVVATAVFDGWVVEVLEVAVVVGVVEDVVSATAELLAEV